MSHITDFLPDAEVGVPNLSHSAMANLAKCPRLFLLRDVCRLTFGGISEPLLRGQLAHLALATLWRGGTLKDADAVVDTACHNLSEWVLEQGLAWGDEIQDKITHCKGVALVAVDHLWGSGTISREHYEVLGVEEVLLRTIDNFQWKGVLDLRIRDKRTGLVHLLDWKFTSKAPREYLRGTTFGWQPRTYQRLTQTDENKPVGLMYVVVQTPTIKWKAAQQWDDYLTECRDWYAGRAGSCAGCKWDHTKRAGAEQTILPHLVPFVWDEISDLTFDAAVLSFKYNATQLPTLQNFPPLGELAGQCGTCEFHKLCSRDVEDWRNVKGLMPKDAIPTVGDPSDHQLAE